MRIVVLAAAFPGERLAWFQRLKRDQARERGGVADLQIGYRPLPRLDAKDIDGRFSPTQANYDVVIEIGIRLEPRPHALGV